MGIVGQALGIADFPAHMNQMSLGQSREFTASLTTI